MTMGSGIAIIGAFGAAAVPDIPLAAPLRYL